MPGQLLFSITKADLKRDTFRCPGNGGQRVNSTSAGVRFTHPPSGAVGKSCVHRQQHLNEREAFKRMLDTKEFKLWHRVECARRMGQHIPETPEQIMVRVDRTIADGLANGTIQVEEIQPYEINS